MYHDTDVNNQIRRTNGKLESSQDVPVLLDHCYSLAP